VAKGRIADGVAEPRGQDGRAADAPDRSLDGVEVERPLGLERARAAFDRLVAFRDEGGRSGHRGMPPESWVYR
jgi:hypothetical protein